MTELEQAQTALLRLECVDSVTAHLVLCDHFHDFRTALISHIRLLEAQAEGGKLVSPFANSKMEIAGKGSLKNNQDWSERALAALTWQAMHAAAPDMLTPAAPMPADGDAS